MSELAANTINKDPIVPRNFSKEVFKFNLHHLFFGFREAIVLMSLLDNYSVKKQDDKKNAIRPICPSSIKIVFILLVKLIVVQT